jgi:hypothetical protein
MKRLLLAAAFVVTAGAAGAQSRCIYGTAGCYDVDLRAMSAAIGYEMQAITGMQGYDDRRGSAIYMSYDIKLLSLLLREAPFRVYDGLFIGISAGRMSSTPISSPALGDEDTDSFSWDFGYQLLAGTRVGPVALLGGLGWRSADYTVGGTTLSGNTQQLVVRAEYGRIVFMGYLPFSGAASTGARLDIPFFRRLNLTGMLWTQDGTTDSGWIPVPLKASSTRLMVGVRTAEM